MIEFHQEDLNATIKNKRNIKSWVQNSVEKEGKTLGDITLVFTSDDYLLQMNREHLDHDYYTDIITFDYVEDDLISGDLFISYDRVKDNAQENKTLLQDELERVIIHGVLHLCGYKDKSPKDKALMTSKEDFYLSLR
jgi:probable rRNA maturation factor